MDPVTTPTPVVSQTPAIPANPVVTPPPAHNSALVWLFGGVIVLLLGVIGILAYKLGIRPGRQAPANNVSQTPSPSPVSATKILFVRNNELWTSTGGEERQVTETGGTVYAYDYHPATDLTAYIWGSKITNENNATYLVPKAVHLKKGSNQATPIYELTPQPRADTDYIYQLRDLAFSADGSKLAITTSESLIIYDVEKGTTEEIFRRQPDSDKNMIYAYIQPRFSPDNSRLILAVGYYEGGGTALVDLASGQVNDLPYAGYAQGKAVAGWLDNNRLLAWEYSVDASYSETIFSKLITVSLPDLTETEILSDPDDISTAYVVNPQTLFYKVDSSSPSGQTRNGVELRDEYETAYKYDLTSSQKTVVWKKQIPETGRNERAGVIRKIGDGVYLETQTYQPGPPPTRGYSIYRLEPRSSQPTINNGSFTVYER